MANKKKNNNRKKNNSLNKSTESKQDAEPNPQKVKKSQDESKDAKVKNVEEKSTAADTVGPDQNRPKGLPNLGNTCFYNSTMQCLLNTHLLRYYFDTVLHRKKVHVPKNYTVKMGAKLVQVPEMEIHIANILEMPIFNSFHSFYNTFINGKSPNPGHLFAQISKKVPRFRGWNQQDAHEFLRYLLDFVRQDEVAHFEREFFAQILGDVEEERNIKQEQQELKQICRALLFGPARPFLDIIFGGILQQTIACSKCHNISVCLEPFFDISLPLHFCDDKVAVFNSSKIYQKLTNKVGENKEKAAKKSETHQDQDTKPNSNQSSPLSKYKQKKAKKESKRKGLRRQKSHSESKSSTKLNPDDEQNASTTASIAITLSIRMEVNLDDEHSTDSHSPVYISKKEHEDESAKNDNESVENKHQPEADGPIDPSRVKSLLDYESGTENGHLTVSKALKYFTSTELLSVGNAYRCEHCFENAKKCGIKAQPSEAYKRYLILTPPLVLTLHLKRFEQVNRRMKKLNDRVEFGKFLDLAPFCSAEVNRIQKHQMHIWYSLYAVVSHSGNMNGGHYVAYVRARSKIEEDWLKEIYQQTLNLNMANYQPDEVEILTKKLTTTALDNAKTETETDGFSSEELRVKCKQPSTWYYCSDSSIHSLSEEEVLRSQAYLLFYERVR